MLFRRQHCLRMGGHIWGQSCARRGPWISFRTLPQIARLSPAFALLCRSLSEAMIQYVCKATATGLDLRFQLLRGLVHPFDEEHGCPVLSKNGKYVVKLYFNGCWRKVVVDDSLPVSNMNRVLHLHDRRNPGLLWPVLLEKAYLKVRGGYDFPGSNSCSDLRVLTGWIPEQIYLQT